MRSTRVSSCARLVITAETCGICDIPAKVAPPLKSTSTMFSCSGEWVIARPSTRVRRNSDFPEPVAPMTRPCGPMPCWADSLMSRWTRPPPSPRPIGTRSRSRAGRGRHAAAGSKWCTSPSPRRSMKSSGPVISRGPRRRSARPETVCSGVSRRAKASAVARSHWSPSASDRVLADPQRLDRHLVRPAAVRAAAVGSTSGSSISRRRREASSSWSHRLGRSSRVTPCRPSGGMTWLPGGRWPPSMTSRMCGVAGRSSAPKRGPVAQVGRQQRRQVGEGGGDHPAGPDGVALLGALGVREPLDPVPVGEVLLGAEHRDDQLAGGVEGGRRADDRAGERPRLLLGPADLDAVEGPQVDARGQVGLDPVHHQQPVQGRRRRGVDLVDRRAVGRHQVDRQGLGAEAVAHVQEVRVPGRVLPHPRPLLGQGGQRRRLGVVPAQRPALLVGGLAGDLADPGEVAEVLRPGAGDLLGALLPLPVELDDDEAERREQEHAGGDVAAAAARRRPWWPRARSTRGCRASGWRSSARRWRPRPARSPGAAGAGCGRSASRVRRAARPEASCSSNPCPVRSEVDRPGGLDDRWALRQRLP